MLKKLTSRIKSLSGDKKSVLALVGGSTVAQALSFLLSPIQTRLFSPEVFGELSVFTSITGVVGAIICLRYELAVVLPKEDDESFALLKLSWLFAALVSGVTLIVFGFFRTQIYMQFNALALTRYWYYVPITLLFMGVIQSANYWLTRKRQFTVLSYNKVLPVLVGYMISIGLGLAGNRALGARLFSTLAGNIINIAVIAWVIVPEMRMKGRKKFRTIELIKKYKNFAIYDIWGSSINNLSWMIIPILMNYYFGSFAAGQYSIGLRVIQLPISIIGASVGQVFMQSASEKRNTRELYPYTIKIIKMLFLYTLPFALLIFFFGKILFKIAFGDKWEIAGLYAQILSPWAMIWFLSNPISSLYSVLQKQNIHLIIAIINLITRFLSLYLGAKLNSPVLGIVFFSVSGSVVYFVFLIVAVLLAKDNSRFFK